MLEAAILTTIAFVLIVPIMYLYADANGFYVIDEKLVENGQLNIDYPQNRFGSHFALVTIITYVVLLGISLLGTYIPATLAARMQPADVLKDE